MKNLVLVAILWCSSFFGFAQEDVNQYRYVVVPKQFEFQKEAGQYQLNGLTRFLFEKYGFEAYLEGEVPDALMNNPCEGLKGVVKDESGMLTTKVKVLLMDCRNNVVFETKEGKTKEKDYSKSFNLAIREAFEDIDELNYAYDGTTTTAPVAVAVTSTEVKVAANKPKDTIEANEALTVKLVDAMNYEVYDADGNFKMTLLYTPSKNVYIVKGEDAIVYKNEKGLWVYFVSNGMNMTAKGLQIDL